MTSSFLPSIGGRELVVHNLACALSRLGHTVFVFVPFHKRRKKQADLPYRIVQYGFRGAGRLGVMKPSLYGRLQLFLLQKQIDVINIHGVFWKTAGLFPYICRMSRIPVVATPHGQDIQIFPDIGYGFRLDPKNDKSVRYNLSLSDRITVISQSIREHVEEIVSDRSKIVDLPNGIWSENFQNCRHPKAIRTKYGIPADAFVMVSVGRNHPKKGFEIGLDALSILSNSHLKLIYLLIGREMESLQKKAQEKGISDRLITPGQLTPDQVAELFQASDLYVSPSLIESFGITTIEAMSAGLPCIVSDIEGSRDIVSSRFGEFVPPGDANALADAIKQLMENQSAFAEMGRQAIQEAKQYDWEKIARKYEAVYRDIVAEKQIPCHS